MYFVFIHCCFRFTLTGHMMLFVELDIIQTDDEGILIQVAGWTIPSF